ncbi:hypothetical protein [Corynebacterium pacaense]|uniref:hypothetical protein n=1 Tax=Corynebacterium pacaense TaxID=1816684 RepID=UPI0009BB5253|nr:hypothetical protein [Corynebacterium pacaense]
MPIAFTRRTAALSWASTRILLLVVAAQFQAPLGDVRYYLRELNREASGQRALEEYPDISILSSPGFCRG